MIGPKHILKVSAGSRPMSRLAETMTQHLRNTTRQAQMCIGLQAIATILRNCILRKNIFVPIPWISRPVKQNGEMATLKEPTIRRN